MFVPWIFCKHVTPVKEGDISQTYERFEKTTANLFLFAGVVEYPETLFDQVQPDYLKLLTLHLPR